MNPFYNEKEEAFNKSVEEIEAKNSFVFAEAINIITGKKPDKLRNHFLITNDGYKRTIGFERECYIPKAIQDEVLQSFMSHFS